MGHSARGHMVVLFRGDVSVLCSNDAVAIFDDHMSKGK